MQVTDAKESTIEVRVLFSARNAGDSGDLASEIREKLIAFVQAECPDALPRRRNENRAIALEAERQTGGTGQKAEA